MKVRVKVRATGEHREHALVQVQYGVAAPTLVVKHGVRVDAHLARVRARARARARARVRVRVRVWVRPTHQEVVA